MQEQTNDTTAAREPIETQATVLPAPPKRAGYTTNKGHGEGKKRRKMAAESRRRNRGK